MVELHLDFFGRHTSPLAVDVLRRSTKEVTVSCPTRLFVDVTEKSKRRRRGGRSVQLQAWFIVTNSSSRHLCKYTYVLRTTKHIRRKKEKKKPERQVSGWTCRTCVQNFRVLSLSNCAGISILVRKTCVLT